MAFVSLICFCEDKTLKFFLSPHRFLAHFCPVCLLAQQPPLSFILVPWLCGFSKVTFDFTIDQTVPSVFSTQPFRSQISEGDFCFGEILAHCAGLW